MSREEVCCHCGRRDASKNFVGACKCAKKRDERIHKECLEQLIQSSDDDMPRCKRCNEAYKVSYRLHFTLAWDRLLSGRAIAHAFEFIMVIAMFGCVIFTLWMFLQSEEHKRQGNDGPFYIIVFLFLVTAALIPFTLQKVRNRWIKANADAEVLDVV